MKTRTSAHISCSTCPVKTYCLPKGLNENEIHSLNATMDYVKIFQPGQHLYLANNKINEFYAIYHGICKDYYIDKAGNEYVNNFYFPGDILGLESIQKNITHSYAVALKETIVCVISKERYQEFFHQNSHFQERILNLLCEKLQNHTELQLSINAKQKVAAIYLNLIKKEKQRHPSIASIPVNISQIDMSNKLRLANETFSRALHSLMNENILHIKNHMIQYADMKALEKIAFSKSREHN